MKRCVIIGAAPQQDSAYMRDCIQEGDFLICADGGHLYAKQLGLVPNICIGDFDSSPVPQGFPGELIQTSPIKDDTDLLMCIKKGLELGFQSFLLLGVLGGRLDHTLANIQLLRYLKRHGAQGRIVGAQSTLLLIENESVQLANKGYAYLSVFCMTPQAKEVNLKGLKYPLANAALTYDTPLGVSNEFLGAFCEISVGQGALLIVLQR